MPKKKFTRPLFWGGGGLSFVYYCLKVEYINRLNILKLVRKNFQ